LLIAQITDTHIGFDRDNPDEYNMVRLRAVLERLATGPNRPDMLLLTGDLTEFGDAASYVRLAEAVGICAFPAWPMVGNHDEREALLAGFPQTPQAGGFVQYALEFERFRLLVLDTLDPGRHGGAFCEVRAAWLAGQLADRPDVPTLIAMHHPPFAAGVDWLDSDMREPWIARFSATVQGHPQVKAVISGHLHRTIHTSWNGIHLTVCSSTAPAVGLDLRPIDPDRPDGRAMIVDELPGYALHRWDGRQLTSHFEAVGALNTLASYDEGMQQVVRLIDDERPK
jgi:3',5'-cyclic AMP phosphodiesterase CpdA